MVFAGGAQGLSGDGTLQCEPHITLPTIRASEISSSSTVDLSALRAVASQGFEVSGRANGHLSGRAEPQVEREVTELWQLHLPIAVPPHELEVNYELISSRGRPGHFSHVDREGADLRVLIDPIPPLVIRRDGDNAVVQGGVVLVFDVFTATFAGTYLGTLTTTVTHR